ncbi:MAG: hypothetical protein GY925_07895 [Actinomycetia bacterium]|nr:hypothetical protein [Actinomycetes bacterium]
MYGSKQFTSRMTQPDLLRRIFLEIFPHDYVTGWYEQEFKRFTGIDVFDVEFDVTRGATSISCGQFDLLLLRSDRLNDNLPLISEFVGSAIKLTRENEASDKWYGPVYEEFREGLKLPEVLVERLLTTQYTSHFFDPAEIAEVWARYT